MSKIALSGNPSGTGTFTIASPNSNTDRTLNLPDAAGTVATQEFASNASNLSSGTVATARLGSGTPSASNFLRGDGAWSVLPASGKVLQVVSTTKTDVFSIGGSSTGDITGLTATITPSSTASKILVLYTINGCATGHARLTLVRDSTNIFIGAPAGSRPGASHQLHNSPNPDEAIVYSGVHLDSPNTTSALTYKISVTTFSGITFFAGRARNDVDRPENPRLPCSITVMEIAA
jgi:hypothetical protein